MITALKRTAIVSLLGIIAFTSKAQLVITPNTVAQQLAQRLVGDGITISNATLSGSPLATGFFRNISGNQINLDSGIVMSTGRVLSTGSFDYGVDGPATNFASTGHGVGGDAQLSAILAALNMPSTVTNDAVILEFDFVPIGDTVKFRYVFGSEEYPSFTCSSFTDIFAFFISGPGITGSKNIALVPGTNIPVAINSINSGTNGDFSGYCANMGPGSPFPQFFINGSSSTSYTHDGHTVVLTAQSVVTPCQTYHLKLAIADVSDGAYDSGVFIQARSLTSTPLQIVNNNPVSATGQAYVIEGCTAGSIKIDRKRKFNFAQPVNITYAGTAQNSVDIQTMPTQVTIPANDSIVTVPIFPIPDNIIEGDETFKIYITFGSCGSASNFYADSLTILVRDQLRGTATVTPTACSNNTGSVSITVPSNNGNAPYQYSINGGNFQASNVFSGLPTGNTLITVRDSNGCVHNIVTNVGLNNNLTVNARPADTSVCRGASFVPQVTSVATQYSWSPSSGLSSASVAQPTITVNNDIQYIVTAYQGPCVRTDTINITALVPPTISAGPDITMISGDVVQIMATAGPGTYNWTPPTGLSSPTVLQPNASPTQTTPYTLTAVSPQGCISTDAMTITVLNCVEPMDAFTPNGDGMNDRWLVNLRACYTKAIVEVFNRYGNRVFRSENYQNDWDGRYEGKPLPDATYYYVITLDLINGRKTYVKGNVTILR